MPSESSGNNSTVMNRRVNTSKSTHSGDAPAHSSQSDNSPSNRAQSPTKRGGPLGRKRAASPSDDNSDIHSENASRNININKGAKKTRPYRKESSSNHHWEEDSLSPNRDGGPSQACDKENELEDLECATGSVRLDAAELKKITITINRPQSKICIFPNPELITPVRRPDEGKRQIFDRPEIKEASSKRLKMQMAESRNKPEASSGREKVTRDGEKEAGSSTRNSSRRSVSPRHRSEKYERVRDRKDDRLRRSPHRSSPDRRGRSADRERRDRDRRRSTDRRRSLEREERRRSREPEAHSSERHSRSQTTERQDQSENIHNPEGGEVMSVRPRMRGPYPMVPMRPMGPFVPVPYPPMFFPHPVPFPPRRPPRGYYPSH